MTFLPDGRHFLARLPDGVVGASSTLGVGTLDSKEMKPLGIETSYAAWARPGWLIYGTRGVLVARRFDDRALRFTGEPQPLSTGMARDSGFAGRFSVSNNGVLLLQRNQADDVQLTWLDRSGHALGTLGPVTRSARGQEFQLSPDGRRVVIKRDTDIWLIDVARGTQDRLTTDPGLDQLPVWSADGRSLFTSSFRYGVGGVNRIAADGSGEQLVLKGTFFPHAATPDGRFLIYLHRGEQTRVDAWELPLARGEPIPLLDSEFDELDPRVSPDGRWLAYSSDVTGNQEIYVRALAAGVRPGEAVRLSTGGGIGPRWSPDGNGLYFARPVSAQEGEGMAVSLHPVGATLSVGATPPLYRAPLSMTTTAPEYEVTPDGQRFLIGRLVGTSVPHQVTLVLNWVGELPR